VFAAAVVVVVGAVAYHDTLRGEFVWDDDLLLVDHPQYRHPGLVGKALFDLFLISPNYYRPLVYLTMFTDSFVWGLRPWGFRLVNLLLHLGTGVAVLWLLSGLVRDRRLAVLTAVLFVLHPTHVENVSFISGRFDLMCGLFYFLGLAVVVTGAFQRWRLRWAAAGALFLLALLSKEMAITLPAMLYVLGRRSDKRASAANVITYSLPAVLAYLILRQLSLGGVLGTGLRVPEVGNVLQRAILVASSLATYLRLLILPYWLTPVHQRTIPLPLIDFGTWLSVMVSAVAVVALVLSRKRFPNLFVAGCLLLISLGPVINIIPISLAGPSIVAERFLYIPSFFFLLGAAWLLEQAAADHRVGKRTTVALVIVAATYFATVWRHVPFWKSDVTLFEWALRTSPRSALPWTNLGLERIRAGDYETGIRMARRAVELDPDNGSAYDNLGVGLFYSGRCREAEEAFRKAVSIEPRNLLYRNNLAGALRDQGKLDQAIAILTNEVLPLDPTMSAAHLNLAFCYMKLGDPTTALSYLEKGIHYDPYNPDLFLQKAEAHRALGQLSAARAAYNRVLELRPHHQKALEGLAALHEASGQTDDALATYLAALQADPSQLPARLQAASLLMQRGDPAGAQSLLVAGLTVGPPNPLLLNNLGVALRIQGKYLEAASRFRDAAAMDSTFLLARSNLAHALILAGEEAGAESVLTPLVEHHPDFPDPHFHLGRMLVLAGRVSDGELQLERYLMLAPTGEFAPEARRLLAHPAAGDRGSNGTGASARTG
jgi:tetratricopeptide (TPR) repeat protein